MKNEEWNMKKWEWKMKKWKTKNRTEIDNGVKEKRREEKRKGEHKIVCKNAHHDKIR